MNSFIEYLNLHGGQFLNFAWPMLWQSSLLIAVVLAVDFALARRIRASVRHALWLVVLVKLLLPPTLALPTGAAWWLFPAKPAIKPPAATRSYAVTYENPMPALVFEQKSFVRSTEPSPVPPPPPAPKLNPVGWTLLGCAAVSLALLAWLLCRWWQLLRKVRSASAPEAFTTALHQARHRAGLPPGTRLKLVEGNLSPAVCGLFRPVILLPRLLVEHLSPEQLHAVLLHESIHLRRKDIWVNCAQALLQIVYWWHPLVWVANARIRRVREEAVDDAVMLALDQETDLYAATLLDVAKLAFKRPSMSLGIVGIMESRSALRQRVERLMDFHAPRRAGLTLVSLLGIFAFSAVALPMGEGPARVEQTPPPAAVMPTPSAQISNQSPVSVTASSNMLATYTGILTDPNFRTALRALEQRTGTEKLGEPEVTVTSGRPMPLRRENVAEIYPARSFLLNQPNKPTGGAPDSMKTTVPVAVEPGPPAAEQGKITPQVSISAQFYRMPAENFERITSALEFNKGYRSDDSWWTIFPEEFGFSPASGYGLSLQIGLKSRGVRLLAEPQIQTLSGRETEISAGDGTNGLQFNCTSSVKGNLVDLIVHGQLVDREDGTLHTNRFQTTAATVNGGGVLIRLGNGPAANVLVGVIGVMVFTNAPSGRENEPDMLVQAGKLLFERHRFDEAELKFKTALAQAPGNATALDYLDVLKNMQPSLETRPDFFFPAYTGTAVLSGKAITHTQSPILFTGPGRQAIVAKLDQIHLDSVSYDGLPLAEVLKQLAEQCKLRDPEHKGINFLIKNGPGLSDQRQAPKTNENALGFNWIPGQSSVGNQPVGSATSVPTGDEAATEQQDVGSFIITIPKLTNVRLADVLDAIVLVSDHPLKYSIQDFAVVFSAKGPATPQLFGRSFLVDPKVFQPLPPSGGAVTGSISQTSSPISLNELRKRITEAGVDLASPPGKSIFHNERLSTLYVKAAESDLDVIAKIVDKLNAEAAHSTNAIPAGADTATLVQDGKVLYEMGKLGEAEVKLKTALAQDPGNATANYYLNLVQNARPAVPLIGRLLAEHDANSTNSLHFTGPGRQAINAKLDKIHLDNVSYDGLPLSEVLKQLAVQCKQRDPEKKGINFLINDNPNLSDTAPQQDVGSFVIRIPGLSDVRLADVLNAIVLVSDHPLTYSIQDFGVMFYAKDPAAPQAFTRTFRADPNTFYSGLESVGAQSFGAAQNGNGNSQSQNNGAVVGDVNAFPGASGVRNSGGGGGGNGGGGAGQGGSGSLLNTPAAMEGDPQPAPQSALTSPGRQALVSKLAHIHLPKVTFDRLSLSEVARQLTEATKQYDPDRVGVHFTTSTNSVFREWDEINSIVIHIPSLTDVRLADALDAVILVAGKPIGYSILDDGIVFSAKEETTNLFMRTFRVDPNTFYSGLESVTAGTFSNALKNAGANNGQLKNLGDGLDNFSPGNSSRAYITTQTSTTTPSALARAFFSTLGVNLSNPPGKSVFFNDKLGVLFVKATESDLDTIERALQVLITTPPQVHLKVRFMEIPKQDATKPGIDWNLGQSHAGNQAAGILTDANFRVALRALPGMESLGEPEITVISGRQTQLRATRVSQRWDPDKDAVISQADPTETMPIDVVPYVLADGYTISLTVMPPDTDFGRSQLSGNLNVVPLPVPPRFPTRHLITTANVWDNQTLVLRMNEQVPDKTAKIEMPKGSSSTKTVDKELIIFITATIVDPAGSRVHNDDDLPFAKDGIPHQPSQPSQPSPIQMY